MKHYEEMKKIAECDRIIRWYENQPALNKEAEEPTRMYMQAKACREQTMRLLEMLVRAGL